MNDVDTGALGPSGRFARIEAALDRIELKLDVKADVTTTAALEGRLAALELRDSNREAVITAQSTAVDNRFRWLASAVGSITALSAVASIVALINSVP